MAAILIWCVIGFPWLGGIFVWIAGWKRLAFAKTRSFQHGAAVFFSAAAGIASLFLLGQATDQAVIHIPVTDYLGELTFIPNGLGVFLTAVAAVIGCLAVIFSVDYMRNETELSRYYFLVLFFIGAMAGLVLSGSLLFMFIFWEITALCSYGLISFYNDDPKAVAGGIKALVITQFGGIGLLAVALLAYAFFGTYDINFFLSRAHTLPHQVLSIAAFGMLAAAAAKSAQVPFHSWLPDAMEAPTPVSALIHAATMVNAGVYALARFYPAFSPVTYWKPAVMAVGILSVVLAAIMAMTAVDLKRVLAYSTISQLGYMVYAVGVGGVFASQFHLLSHAVFKALLFLAAGAVIHTLETRDMRQMGRNRARLPFVRAVFIIGGLGLAGIPILNGFWSKELILEAGLLGGQGWAFLLALLAAGLTAFYTLRAVWMVFYAPTNGTDEENAHPVHDAPMAMRTALTPLAFGVFTTWLLAGPFSQMLHSTMPGETFEPLTTLDMVTEVLLAPATWIAMLVIAAGLAAWQGRARLVWLARRTAPFADWAEAGFGFEILNRWVVDSTRRAADQLAVLQTGQLNWNLVGFSAGLLVVLTWLAWIIF